MIHSGIETGRIIKIKWIQAEDVDTSNVADKLKGVQGVIVPGGFGPRAMEGKIATIQYVREQNIPYLGLCLGMQMAVVEFARHVVGLDAHTTELDESTSHPVIDYLPEQYAGIDYGGTLRLGLYDCEIQEGTLAHKVYQTTAIKERHRHRYEFNNAYKQQLEEKGMVFSGVNPQTGLAEIIEIPSHPFFIAGQFHPEFLSRPNRPHPLFLAFVKESIQRRPI